MLGNEANAYLCDFQINFIWFVSKVVKPGFPRVGRKISELILLVIRIRRRSHFCLSAEISTMEKQSNLILIITLDAEVGSDNKNDIYVVKFYSLCNGAGPNVAWVYLTTPQRTFFLKSLKKKPLRLHRVWDAGAWNREDFTRPAGLQGNTQRKFYLYITSPWHENIVCFCYFCGDKTWWILVNVDDFMNCFDSMKCLLDINKLSYAFYCTF